LVKILPPRPIHDYAEYEEAVEMLGRLIGFNLNSDQDDYVDALATFTERYEDEHPDKYHVDTSHITGLDILRGLMEEHEWSGANLGDLLGVHRTHANKIMAGDRAITADHARTLGEHFKLDPGAFLRQG
jgi:antitoxin component HigA of HigAB toxin-antitoxin module